MEPRIKHTLAAIQKLEEEGKDPVSLLSYWANKNQISVSSYNELADIVRALGMNLTKKFMVAVKETKDEDLISLKKDVIADLESKEWNWQ